jgi:hypothetical protein
MNRASEGVERITATHLNDILRELALERPVFHSEADFQHALAWAMQVKFPTAGVRLEVPIDGFHVDLIVQGGNFREAFELKYKTKGGIYCVGNELFHLKQHSAQDIGRYDFLKDLCRLEGFVTSGAAEQGWALLLTNDPRYWTLGRTGTVDSAFRIHEGTALEGAVEWDKRASDGTKKRREQSLVFSGKYGLTWGTYSRAPEVQFSNEKKAGAGLKKVDCEFKYLLLQVSRKNGSLSLSKEKA